MKTIYMGLEGGEGSGKTTAVATLKESFGDSVVFVQEPGTTELGIAGRELMFKRPFSKQASADTIHSFMWGVRFDIQKNVVVPALRSGKTVISDRTLASSYAYNVYAQTDGALEEVFLAQCKRLTAVPGIIFFFDVDPKEGMARARSRNSNSTEGNHFDELDIKFHTKVREGYLKYFASLRGTNSHVITIDANKPLAEVKTKFLSVVKFELGL